MVATNLQHAPACATTLIVSLGLLSSLADALLVGVAIVVLLATYRALRAVEVAPVRPAAERAG